MKTLTPISVVIITLNEEDNIFDCVQSAKEVAEEVIVVDAGSADNTQIIAKEAGAIVIENTWLGYGQQKNFGHTKCSYDWILSLDADERLDPQLVSGIKSIEFDEDHIYELNVKTKYLERWIRYCGWYPNYKKRIFNKKYAKWSSDQVHEYLESTMPLESIRLQGNILHYSYRSVENHYQKVEQYARLTALKWLETGKQPYIWKRIFGAWFRFIKTYLFRLGFLDGREGWLISKISAHLVRRQLAYYDQLKQG